METPALKLISILKKLLEDEKIDPGYKNDLQKIMPGYFLILILLLIFFRYFTTKLF
jgi:hypothetical protein